MGGCDNVQSATERSYPTSEVRGRSSEDLVPEGRWPRGVTPSQRSGAEAKSARLRQRRSTREELPHVPGQGRWPGGATRSLKPGAVAEMSNPSPRNGGCTGSGGPKGAIPRSRSGGAAVRRYPSSKVRSSGCTLLEQP